MNKLFSALHRLLVAKTFIRPTTRQKMLNAFVILAMLLSFSASTGSKAAPDETNPSSIVDLAGREAAEQEVTNGQDVSFVPEASTIPEMLNSNPSISWSVPVDGLGTHLNDIATDASGNIYVTGYTCYLCSHQNILVKKIDSAGHTQWSYNPSGTGEGQGITVDNNGNVYVTGSKNSGSSENILLVKFSNDGTLLWDNDSIGSGAGLDIALDILGNIYVTGISHASGDEYGDTFVAQFSQNQNSATRQWNTFLGGDWDDVGRGITLGSDGNIYVTGQDRVDYNSPEDIFVASLDLDGDPLWYTNFGSGDGFDIASDEIGNVYVTGIRFITRTTRNAFVAKFTNTGDLVWNTTLGGNDVVTVGEGVDVDGSGKNIYVSGDSDKAWGYPYTSGVPHNTAAAFAAKLDQNGDLRWNAFFKETVNYNDAQARVAFENGHLYVSSNIDFWDDSYAFVTKISDPKPPLILVHGWQGLVEGHDCSGGDLNLGIERYAPTPSNPEQPYGDSTLGPMPSWFAEMGYDVWIAHWKTSKSGTPSLAWNAKCLRNQINYVGETTGQPIVIVAHSMGGVISRAALYGLNSNVKVTDLYTMGSPHAGFPGDYLNLKTKFEGVNCLGQRAVCNMLQEPMIRFNADYPNDPNVRYNFIGGVVDGVQGNSWKCGIPGMYLNLDSDCFPGSHSTVGWLDGLGDFVPQSWPSASMPGQYWTDETHSESYNATNNYYSYTAAGMVGDEYKSDAFKCIRALMNHVEPNPQDCHQVVSNPITPNSIEYVSALSGSLGGIFPASTTISIEIDNNSATAFYLQWWGSTPPTFTLNRPDGQLIDPAYAAGHPAEVSYENFAGGPEEPPHMVYKFNSTPVGTWHLNLSVTTEMDFQVLVITQGDLKLSAQTDKDLYQIGDIAALTAHLENDGTGIVGATVTAKIIRPDSVEDTVTLTDQGNGDYIANYIIPATPGTLTININASGSVFGIDFTRAKELMVSVASNQLQLTGNYSENAVDSNSDEEYDSLDFTAEVHLPAPASYAVTADLYRGTQLITHTSDFVDLTAGTQNVTLHFESSAIRLSGLDGPYTITNLSFTPLDLGIPSAEAEDVLTTAGYSHTQFWAPRISGNAGVSGAVLSYRDRTNKTTTTDASGNYSFVVSRNWSGVVSVTKTGYTFAPAGTSYVNVVADRADQNYTAIPIRYTISGNAGASGAKLSYVDGTAKTATANSSGAYSFTVSYNWSGTVTPSKAGYTFTPASRSYANVLSDQTGQNYSATAGLTISGNVGTGGATLSYTDGIAKLATADTNGNYSFTVSYNWSGTVTPAKAGYSFSPTSITYTNVTSNQINQNYTAIPIRYTISGNAGAPGAALSYVDGTNKTTATDSSGDYSFTVPYNWSGTVTPTKAGYTFNPTSITYTNVTSNQMNQNYTGTYTATGSILLVDDDDDDPDVQSYYTDVLDALGESYDVWDTDDSDAEPNAEILANYDTVIWFTGVSYTDYVGPGPAGEAALGSWLDDGGCFFISSQDYLYTRELTTFASSYLGVSDYTSDVGQSEVTGSGRIFGGLGPYTLSYPFDDYSDELAPDVTAEIAFIGDNGITALNKIGTTYKTVFFSFPFEAISGLADRQDVMGGFLNACADVPQVSSIVRSSANPTKANYVNYTVTFSKPVTGVDESDFAITTTGVSDAAISGVSGSGAIYTIAVNTGSGNGTIRLDVIDDDTVVSAGSVPLGGVGTGNGNFVTGDEYDLLAGATDVVVTVLDTDNHPKEGLHIYTFNGASYIGYQGVTDEEGRATLILPRGNYRFRADLNGTQFWSETASHCAVPSCTDAQVVVTQPLVVTVSDTGSLPVEGLHVYAFNGASYTGYHRVTDGDGHVVFTLPQGSYRFRADLNGTQFWSGADNHCDIPGCTTSTVTVTNSVLVTVQNTDGTPTAGLKVYAFNGTTYSGYSGTTNESGQVSFTLPLGSYRFRADLNGTQFWSATANHCDIPSCSSASVTVSKTVTVTVLDTDGLAQLGLSVYAFTDSTYSGYSKITNADGQVVFTLPLGSYRFRADLNGTQFWSATSNHCDIPGCINASVTVTKPVTVTILDTDGTPKAGLNVYAFNGSTYTNYSKVTDASGQAIFTLPLSSYRFRADFNGTQFWSGAVNHCDLPGCQSAQVIVIIPVVVIIQSADGTLRSGVIVYAFNGSTYTGYSKISDSNGQAIFTLPSGNYRFRADYNGTQYWSGTMNHCALPGCMTVPLQVGSP